MLKKHTVLMPSWKGAELLKISIPAILRSFREDSELIVILNEADKESIEICDENKVLSVKLEQNKGTGAIDYAIPQIKGEYVTNINSDMIPSPGWDKNLIEIIEKYHPCSASSFLIEPRFTNNPIVLIQDLGSFNSAESKFLKFFASNYYMIESKVNYMHPIMVKTSDFLKVGGYSDNFDENWLPGFGLDDFFPFRLWKLYEEKFKFITSNKDCVYHGISMTNDKLSLDLRGKNNNDYFCKKTGMSIPEFNQKIDRNKTTKEAYGIVL